MCCIVLLNQLMVTDGVFFVCVVCPAFPEKKHQRLIIFFNKLNWFFSICKHGGKGREVFNFSFKIIPFKMSTKTLRISPKHGLIQSLCWAKNNNYPKKLKKLQLVLGKILWVQGFYIASILIEGCLKASRTKD